MKLPPDVRVGDVVLGVVTAAVVLVGSGLAVESTVAAAERPFPPDILEPGEVAVAVTSVEVDVPAGPTRAPESPEIGAPPAAAIPPATSAAPDPDAPIGLGSAPVPPRPADAPAPQTGPLPERPKGGIRGLPRISPPRASSRPNPSLSDLPVPTEPGFGPGGPTVAPGPAEPEDSPNDPYAYVDPATEDPNAPPNSGVVSDDDADANPNGTMDPLAARALAAYRQRLGHWLQQRFVLRDSGLSKEFLAKAVIRAKIEVSDEGVVIGYAIDPGGHPKLEAAARAALESVKGQRVPELPEHYPGPLQRWVRVKFVCTEDLCN